MPTSELFLTETMTFNAAYDTMVEANLNESQINTMIWGLLGESLGTTQHVFHYSDTFDAQKPGCAVSFERSFNHTDWIDGESVVQAEETTIEEGFNIRFHRIEDDLDSLGAALEKVSGCCGDMREEIAARLGDLKTEINRINTVLHSTATPAPQPWPYYPTPINPPIATPTPLPSPYPTPYPIDTNPGFPFPVTPYPGGMNPFPVPGGIVGVGDPFEMQPWHNGTPAAGGIFEATLNGLTQPVYEAQMVMRSANDPTVGTVAGLAARRLDIDDFNGSAHEVWSTAAGIVLTPAGEGVQRVDQTERSWVNPATKAVGDVAQWFGDNPKITEEVFSNKEVSVGQLIERFGTDRLDGGSSLESRLRSLPSGMKLKKPSDLVGALADRAVSASQREGVGMETLVSNIGISSGAENVKDVRIENYRGLPLEARLSLKDNGITTVGKLTDNSPKEIAQVLDKAGIPNAAASAARWQGEAQMITRLGASLKTVGR